MVKKIAICLIIVAAVILTMIFMSKDKTIVSDNGVITGINSSEETLKIDISTIREYLNPDIFICDKRTKYYKSSDGREGNERIQFRDLAVGQNIFVKYDFISGRVYEIIVRK